MPKTIMIKDETYARLKIMKEAKGMSFTELLEQFMEKNNIQKKTERLLALKGTWKDTPADRKIEEWVKKGWKEWDKKYA